MPSWHFGGQSYWGQGILQEAGETTSLALWRAARAGRLFAESDAKAREIGLSRAPATHLRMLFTFDPDEPPPLAPDLFAAALSRGATEGLAIELAEACSAISRWASETWRMTTAAHFAELAARLDYENPEYANGAGRICRNIGMTDRASVWFERGFRLALRHRRRTEAVRALLGYGALMQEIGRLEEAKRWFLKAARRAARTGRFRSAAETRHDLMALAAESGDIDGAIKHAAAAVELYPLHHDRLPYLAHDFAFGLLRNQQQYRLAFSLLDLFVRIIPARHLLPGVATFAWAAAGRGVIHRFEEAERRTLTAAESDEHQAAASLIFLAEANRLLGRWDRAKRHASAAIRIAQRLGQGRFEQDAQILLDALTERRLPTPDSVADSPEVLALARHLVTRLKRWKPRLSDVRDVEEKNAAEREANLGKRA